MFQITLSAASGRTVTVQAQTANGIGVSGAVAGSDYTAVAQTVTFTPARPCRPSACRWATWWTRWTRRSA
ncbi:MAG: hypothetical protein U0821_04185 [Chloroflexota bacterium]